jgi:hypothetical protein
MVKEVGVQWDCPFSERFKIKKRKPLKERTNQMNPERDADETHSLVEYLRAAAATGGNMRRSR